MPQPILNARAMKVTVVLDPVEVAQLVAPDGQPRVAVGSPGARYNRRARLRRRLGARAGQAGWRRYHRGGDHGAAKGAAPGRGGGGMSKIPSLNRVEAEFFRQMDEIATDVMASLDEFADDAAGGVSAEVEQWLRCGVAIVQELATHVLASAAVSTERERTDLMRALDALQARLDAHVAARPQWRRRQ